MRCHWPLTSLVGYFRRRSPPTVSRMAAPLAQWVPRLMGLSQLGSWPTQTPFCTSAVTVQPTEQWVQMFLRISTGADGDAGPAAAALRTDPNGIAPTAASPPTARPDCLRKVRRSRVPAARPAVRACSLLRLASPLLRLI